ncbi:hypothetical protein IQ252_13620 [Tychonema sp. LEGE 07203]|nr:hypothetical protein [Tychonema sp. LEGE 07203]
MLGAAELLDAALFWMAAAQLLVWGDWVRAILKDFRPRLNRVIKTFFWLFNV